MLGLTKAVPTLGHFTTNVRQFITELRHLKRRTCCRAIESSLVSKASCFLCATSYRACCLGKPNPSNNKSLIQLDPYRLSELVTCVLRTSSALNRPSPPQSPPSQQIINSPPGYSSEPASGIVDASIILPHDRHSQRHNLTHSIRSDVTLGAHAQHLRIGPRNLGDLPAFRFKDQPWPER
jgi:hypothetical protein